MFSKTITFASLASIASAHVVVYEPAIFPLIGGVINAPLYGESKAPFPCGTDKFTGVQSTVWQAGSTQNIKLKGTAVHGGGSCQVSVTTDLNPTSDSVWKVIKSIEGGCPARNVDGNIEPGDAELPLPEGYDVEVPDLPVGSYTLAWTWFNKVGNREMYMNCAPIEITGGSGSVDPSSLPDMFVANIPQSSCTVPEATDLKFPDPGLNVVQYGTGNYADPVGECGYSSGVVQAPIQTPLEPAQVSVKTPVQTPVQPPVQTASSGCSKGKNTCIEGNWWCIDGVSYRRCASGTWSPIMYVAAGTTCIIGESDTLKLT